MFIGINDNKEKFIKYFDGDIELHNDLVLISSKMSDIKYFLKRSEIIGLLYMDKVTRILTKNDQIDISVNTNPEKLMSIL